jgi:hypothetical protein
MRLAILFWFYKHLDLCESRVRLLRQFNPGLPIFGLNGGEAASLAVDDLYRCPWEDPGRKWWYGDVMLLDWYRQRGRHLEWDSIAVVQWDALVLSPIAALLPDLQKDQLFLTGLGELTPDDEAAWHWTRPDQPQRHAYEQFLLHVWNRHGQMWRPLWCIFIFAVLPRVFFERYGDVDHRLGFLEYRLPTYARILGVPFYRRDLGCCHGLPMNGCGQEIPRGYIDQQMSNPTGHRLFHPYFAPYP